MKDDGILVAACSATFRHEGRMVTLRRGVTKVRAGHPMVKGREQMFTPLIVDYEHETGSAPVEEATAVPGEKRQVSPKARQPRRKPEGG